MKANHKLLKTILASRVKKLGPFLLATKWGKFLLFDNFFLDLADFWDLDNLLVFDNFWDLDNFPVFDDFSYFSINSSLSSTPLTSLAASTLLATSIYVDTIVFNIDISSAAILLKL